MAKELDVVIQDHIMYQLQADYDLCSESMRDQVRIGLLRWLDIKAAGPTTDDDD